MPLAGFYPAGAGITYAEKLPAPVVPPLPEHGAGSANRPAGRSDSSPAIVIPHGSVPYYQAGLYPLIVTSQTIPIIAVAPLFIILFGYGLMPKIVVALVCFLPAGRQYS